MLQQNCDTKAVFDDVLPLLEKVSVPDQSRKETSQGVRNSTNKLF